VIVVPTYEEITQRNIGVVTDDEQAKIRALRVAVAGCGALGAPTAHFLARLGVGELRLADPEEFEPSNINRQFGAYVDTVGVNKAEAVARELVRINPEVEVRTFADGVTEECLDAFLDGADVVVDGLDFFSLGIQLRLHEEACRRGQWVYAGQGVVEISTTTCFDPAQPALAEMVCEQGNPSVAKAVTSFFPVLPRSATPELLQRAISGELPSVPSDVSGAAFGGAFLVEDILRTAIRHWPPHAVAPDVYVFNQEELWVRRWDAGRRAWTAL
jgi:molybdopterin/thiamine biosynthesis adenylyltransferase